MAAINVQQVVPENSLVPFDSPFAFAIEYECLYALKEDLEWKMIYVGSAENETCDQVLDSVLVGPVLAGNYKFTFEGNAPDPAKIPSDDLIGVTGQEGLCPCWVCFGVMSPCCLHDLLTDMQHACQPCLLPRAVVLLTCSYKSKEFIRIGYYVNVDYNDEQLRENPPETPQIASLYRTVLTDHPRVTRFPVDFDNDALPEAAVAAPAVDPAGMDQQQAAPMVF